MTHTAHVKGQIAIACYELFYIEVGQGLRTAGY